MSRIFNLENNEMLVTKIETNMGTIEAELFLDKTPVTAENFAGLAQMGYYDGVTFHRVIDGFMIQGGDPTGTGAGGNSFYGDDFQDEFHAELKHDSEGIFSMANRGPATNGSQFFITLAPTPHLNNRHTVFGKVIAGLDVVKKIGCVKTSGYPSDRPVTPVVMEKVTVEIRVK